MRSTLLLNDITCVDLALYTPTLDTFNVKGYSYMVTVKVTGEVEPNEGVVVDFGTLKRDIKNIIDNGHPNLQYGKHGIDHKIVVPIASEYGNPQEVARNFIQKFITVPEDAICAIPFTNSESLQTSKLGYTLEYFIKSMLSIVYPDLTFSVYLSNKHVNERVLNQLFCSVSWGQSHSFYFNYCHGLPNSTSKGCQNIAHGHRSLICLKTLSTPTYMSSMEVSVIKVLNKLFQHHSEHIPLYFVAKPNINLVGVDYTCSRGSMHMDTAVSGMRVIALEDTTAEYLIRFIDRLFVVASYMIDFSPIVTLGSIEEYRLHFIYQKRLYSETELLAVLQNLLTSQDFIDDIMLLDDETVSAYLSRIGILEIYMSEGLQKGVISKHT